MAGLFGLSVDSSSLEVFWDVLKKGIFYHQHWGEDYSGVAVFNSQGKDFKNGISKGLFRANFWDEEFKGNGGIGCCSPIPQPLSIAESKLGRFSLIFSGNIINRQEIINDLKKKGYALKRGDDVELLGSIILQKGSFREGIMNLEKHIRGAYTLLLLCQGGVYAFRSGDGHWPLVMGSKKGMIAVATESGGFKNLGLNFHRSLKAGEIVLLKDGKVVLREKIVRSRPHICSFLWVYTAFPNALFEGIPASLVRKRLGASLARRDIKKGFVPDIVAPVPDSGRSHAIGYHHQFCKAAEEGKIDKIPRYEEVLLKYPYAGRSYTPRSQELRDIEAEIKILESGEEYWGKVLALIDDSVVRGTQMKTKLIPKLKRLGIKEIHLRISNPELLSNCKWGKTTKKRKSLLACRYPRPEERIKFLDNGDGLVKSLVYNDIKALVDSIGLPEEEICFDCSLLVSEDN